jgi:hypothetical protein
MVVVVSFASLLLLCKLLLVLTLPAQVPCQPSSDAQLRPRWARQCAMVLRRPLAAATAGAPPLTAVLLLLLLLLLAAAGAADGRHLLFVLAVVGAPLLSSAPCGQQTPCKVYVATQGTSGA